MHPRSFPRALSALGIGLLLLACEPSTTEETAAMEPAPEKKAPNVLMIIVDDLNDWIGVMGGHPDTRTPNMDKLASEGTLFMNAHATAAICGPSRASVMTGLRPSTTGIYEQLSDREIKQAGPATENITFMTEYFACLLYTSPSPRDHG